MSEYIDDPELDRRLGEDLAALQADLGRVLDLEAGLADAVLPGRVQAYTDNLDQVLDLDAGLAAILPTGRPLDATVRRDPVTVQSGDLDTGPGTVDTPRGAELLRFARTLESMPAAARLRARLWLPQQHLGSIRLLVRLGRPARENWRSRADILARLLARVLDLANAHAHAYNRDLTQNRDRAYELALPHPNDLELVLDLDGALDRTLNRDLVRDLELAGGLDRARVHARAFDLTLVRDLTRTRDLARARNFAQALARDLARALARDLDLAYELDHGHDHELDRAFARLLDIARGLDHDITRPHTRIHLDADIRVEGQVLARDLADDLELGKVLTAASAGRTEFPEGDEFARAVRADRSAVDLREEDLQEAAEIIGRVVSNVVGDDLRDADLTGIPLEGVRWSSTTRWPPGWHDLMHDKSVEIGPDLWEIGGGGSEKDHLVKRT